MMKILDLTAEVTRTKLLLTEASATLKSAAEKAAIDLGKGEYLAAYAAYLRADQNYDQAVCAARNHGEIVDSKWCADCGAGI